MRIKEKINAFFSLDEEETENWDEEITNQRPPTKGSSRTDRIQPFVKQTSSSFSTRKSDTNVVPMAHHSSQKPKIKIVEPRTYSEVKEIADLVLKNNSVILNFRRIEKDQAKKILDFLTGTVYAIDGDIQRVGEEIFVCTPSNVDIDGTELESLSSTENY